MSCQNIVRCTQSRFALCDLTRISAYHDGLARFIPSNFLTHKSDLDQLRCWSKSFSQTCVLRFYRVSKGQTISEWIHEVIVSPKIRTKNCVFIFWEKQRLPKFILKLSDLYYRLDNQNSMLLFFETNDSFWLD